MKKVNFKKLYAENFLCFGNEGITVDFTNHNNIVLIRGKNLDVVAKSKDDEKHASNGVGKSSIPAILVYGLYGKTVRKPNKISHKDIINHAVGKKLKIEVYWDEYKLQRTRKPDALRLWKSKDGIFNDANEITLGGMPATQKLVEDIIGMTYDTFINVAVFSDDSSSSFLESDAASKRSIVENLLSLEKYRVYHENAKLLLKSHKDYLKSAEKDLFYIEQSHKDEENNFKRLEKSQNDWVENKKNEIAKMTSLIALLSQEKKEVDADDKELKAYELVLKHISELENKIKTYDDALPTFEKNEDSILNLVNQYNSEKTEISNRLQEESSILKSVNQEINKIKSEIQKIENLEDGVKCSHCLSVVDKASHAQLLVSFKKSLQNQQEIFDDIKIKKESIETEFQSNKESLEKALSKQTVIKNALSKCRNEKEKCAKLLNDLLKTKKPEENVKSKAIQTKIDITTGQLNEKMRELQSGNPYDDLIEKSQNNLSEIAQKLENARKDFATKSQKNRLYEFWISAFGDTGIRKYIIDEIVPALNSNIGYWMQFLIDNKISLKFDNEFNETIEKYPTDGSIYLYECMSNGQRRRINLALSQAFAHVMSLNSGKTPNIVFLDEVSSNVDPQGVIGIYNMICEIAKDKQVFVTTHDHDLIDFLNGCDSLDLVMKNGITKLEK
jgi:DNA repair exonuclease SbcCD ATPase subunit